MAFQISSMHSFRDSSYARQCIAFAIQATSRERTTQAPVCRDQSLGGEDADPSESRLVGSTLGDATAYTGT